MYTNRINILKVCVLGLGVCIGSLLAILSHNLLVWTCGNNPSFYVQGYWLEENFGGIQVVFIALAILAGFCVRNIRWAMTLYIGLQFTCWSLSLTIGILQIATQRSSVFIDGKQVSSSPVKETDQAISKPLSD